MLFALELRERLLIILFIHLHIHPFIHLFNLLYHSSSSLSFSWISSFIFIYSSAYFIYNSRLYCWTVDMSVFVRTVENILFEINIIVQFVEHRSFLYFQLMYPDPIHPSSLCILILSILSAYVSWFYPSFQLMYPDSIHPTSLCILILSILPAYVSWSYPSFQLMYPDPIHPFSLCIQILFILPAYVSWSYSSYQLMYPDSIHPSSLCILIHPSRKLSNILFLQSEWELLLILTIIYQITVFIFTLYNVHT